MRGPDAGRPSNRVYGKRPLGRPAGFGEVYEYALRLRDVVAPLVFSALAACAANGPDTRVAELSPVLVLRRSFELVPSVGEAVDRLLPVTGGGAFVRTHSSDFLLRTGDRTLQSLLTVTRAYDPIGLRLANDSSVEFVDAGNSAIVTANLPSGPHTERAFYVPFVPSVAVWHRRSWIVGGVRSKTLFQLVRVPPADSAPIFFASYRTTNDRPPSFHLTVGHDQAVIGTQIDSPFASIIFGRQGSARSLMKPPEAVWQSGSSARRRLVSLPLLRVTCGYLQTISDLNSDDRWLILADRDGKIVQWRFLDAPIGLTVSLTDPNMLIGALTADSSSVVVGFEMEGPCADAGSSIPAP